MEKFTLEEWAMCLVIKDDTNTVVAEFKETRKGQFSFWNNDTLKRAKARLKELNS